MSFDSFSDEITRVGDAIRSFTYDLEHLDDPGYELFDFQSAVEELARATEELRVAVRRAPDEDPAPASSDDSAGKVRR